MKHHLHVCLAVFTCLGIAVSGCTSGNEKSADTKQATTKAPRTLAPTPPSPPPSQTVKPTPSPSTTSPPSPSPTPSPEMTLINDGGMSKQLREAYKKLTAKPKPKTVPESISYESAEYVAWIYMEDITRAIVSGRPELITGRANLSTCVYCKSMLPYAERVRDGTLATPTRWPATRTLLPLTELGPSFAFVHLRTERPQRAELLNKDGRPTGKLGPIRQFWEVRLDWEGGKWRVTNIRQEFSE